MKDKNKEYVFVIFDNRFSNYEVYNLDDKFLGCYDSIKEIEKKFNIII